MSSKHRSTNHRPRPFSKPTEIRSNLKPYLARTRTLLTQKTINLTHPTSQNAGYDRKAMYRGALNRSLGGRVLATVRTRFLTRERSKKRKKRRRNRLAHSVNRERRTSSSFERVREGVRGPLSEATVRTRQGLMSQTDPSTGTGSDRQRERERSRAAREANNGRKDNDRSGPGHRATVQDPCSRQRQRQARAPHATRTRPGLEPRANRVFFLLDYTQCHRICGGLFEPPVNIYYKWLDVEKELFIFYVCRRTIPIQHFPYRKRVKVHGEQRNKKRFGNDNDETKLLDALTNVSAVTVL